MADSWPDLTRVFEYYLRSREALSVLKAVVLGSPGMIDGRSRFFLMSRSEVDEALREMAEELEQQVVLMLVASAEATLGLTRAVSTSPTLLPRGASCKSSLTPFLDSPVCPLIDHAARLPARKLSTRASRTPWSSGRSPDGRQALSRRRADYGMVAPGG